MATERLDVTLKLEAGQYKREAKEAATATGKIAGSADQTTTATGRMGDKLGAFGKVATIALAGVATAAVGRFVGDSLTAFSDLNESLNALEVQYGEHAEGIKALGEEAAQNVGLSNAEFNTFAVSLSAFAQQIAGDSGDVVGTVDTLTTRVSDFASVMNLEVADAAAKFQSGLAGESEPLRKFGVDVSAAKVQAYALSAGIWDGNDAMTEAQKVQARFGTIMEQTSKVQGDFANTADWAANKTRILQASMEDQKAVLGEQLLPLQQAWLDIQSDAIPIIGELALRFGELIGSTTIAEAALGRLGAELGVDTDNAEGMAFAARTVTDNLSDLWGAVDKGAEAGGFWRTEIDKMLSSSTLTKTELQRLVDSGVDYFTNSLKMSTEQAEYFDEALRKQLAYSLTDTEKKLRGGREALDNYWDGTIRAADGTEDLADETDDLAEATRTATSRLEDFQNLVRSQVDPVFALREANIKLAEAEKGVIDARDDFTEDSPEYEQALFDLAEAGYDFQEALIKVAEESHLTRSQFEAQLGAMGVFTAEQIAIMLAEFDDINAFKFDDKEFRITVTGVANILAELNDKRQQAANQASKQTASRFSTTRSGFQERAHGGPVSANETYMVGENGPELFSPNQNGMIIPNNQINSSAFNLTINYPQSTGDDVIDGVRRGLALNGLVGIAETAA